VSGLDFFVDLTITGTVLGLDHTSDVATVRSVFGEPGQVISAHSMLIDTGLVEFGWSRAGAHQDWSVSYFGAQAHRLPLLTEKSLVGSALVERYGKFPSRLDIEELRAAVSARGGTLDERPTANTGYVELWSPVSRISVLAAMDPAATGELAGTVVKMLGPVRQPFAGTEKA
jgi:hypothetical protein